MFIKNYSYIVYVFIIGWKDRSCEACYKNICYKSKILLYEKKNFLNFAKKIGVYSSETNKFITLAVYKNFLRNYLTFDFLLRFLYLSSGTGNNINYELCLAVHPVSLCTSRDDEDKRD